MTVHLNINKAVFNQARDLGINSSRVCERALVDAIRRMGGTCALPSRESPDDPRDNAAEDVIVL